MKSGVKFAAGSDMCWFYPGKTRGEATATMFAALRAAGMMMVTMSVLAFTRLSLLRRIRIGRTVAA